MKENVTVDPNEVAHFAQMADAWWDPRGKFRPLHDLNPVRLTFLRDHVIRHFARDITADRPLSGLSLVDIGCGGGLISEPMARLGAAVTGIDATEKNIPVAQLHAEQSGLTIDYRHSTAESLVAKEQRFDVVLALEIVEHVADVALFLDAVTALVKPGGLIFMSTLNRTVKSYAMAIVGAEYVLRWLPKGTHHWNKFLKPSELILPLESRGMQPVDITGIVLDPFTRRWNLKAGDLDVNYILVASKP